jgi:hypothetical protein
VEAVGASVGAAALRVMTTGLVASVVGAAGATAGVESRCLRECKQAGDGESWSRWFERLQFGECCRSTV